MVWLRGRKVRSLVRQATVAPEEIQSLLAECLPLLSLERQRVLLKISDRLGSPAICGFFRPTILLPRRGLERLDREQLRLIFLHELVHWKRGDLQVNYLQTVLQILYFYNPAVWLAGAIIRRLREQAVDETVLVLRRGEAERYAATLVDLAAVSLQPGEAMLRLVGVVESRTALAGRIKRIVGRPIPKSAKLGLTGLAAVVAIGLLLVPMARSERPAAKSPAVATTGAEQPAPSTATPSPAKQPDTKQAKPADSNDPKPALSGRMVDEAGVPVSDAKIELLPDRGGRQIISQTDEGGRYAIEQIPGAGPYTIQIVSGRCVGIEYRERMQIDLVPGSPTVRDFTLPAACRLQLKVVDEDGQPVRRVWAYSRLLGEPDYMYHEGGATDKGGRLLVGGLKPAGQERLIALRSDDHDLAHLNIVLDNPKVVVDRTVILQTGHTIRGKALCHDGKPAAGWRILALPVWWKLGVSPMGETIGSDGSFELPHVGDERYNVIISVPTGDRGSIPKTVMSGVALPESDKPLEVTIDYPSPSGMTTLKGHVEFQGGKLDRGIHVHAYSKPKNIMVDTYIEPGQSDFELGPMSAATYRISFDSTEIEANDLKNVVVPSKPLDVKIVVRGKMALSGTVVDGSSGDPVQKFSIQVVKLRSLRGPNFGQETRWNAVENDQGKFSVAIVGPGIYTVNVAADGFTPASLDQINTDTDLAKNLKISLTAGQSLSGVVIDENGKPVGGAGWPRSCPVAWNRL